MVSPADRFRLVTATVFVAAVLAGGFALAPSAWTVWIKKDRPIVKRIAALRNACAQRFPFRTTWVTVNGGCVRLTGQSACNGVVRTEPDGLLLDPNPRTASFVAQAKRVAAFDRHCRRNGAAFLYVQYPKKLDVKQTMLPQGVEDGSYANADRLLAALARQEVPAVDWRKHFAATPEDVRRNFYRTDHHWNTEAAFVVARRLAREIATRTKCTPEACEQARHLLDLSQWRRSVLEDRFLGSLGRRTGPLFGGVDDVVVLKPDFETSMSLSVPSKGLDRSGSFEETVMWRWNEVAEGSWSFSDATYSMLYVGGLYPMSVHRNPTAPLARKVLLVADSYSRPVAAFLSVVCQEVVVIDPRRCSSQFSLAREVTRRHPDLVIQALTPSSLIASSMVDKSRKNVMFDYGL